MALAWRWKSGESPPASFVPIAWPVAFTWMGIACVFNATRCGRMHCYFTGPFFLLLAAVSAAHRSLGPKRLAVAGVFEWPSEPERYPSALTDLHATLPFDRLRFAVERSDLVPHGVPGAALMRRDDAISDQPDGGPCAPAVARAVTP